MKSFFFTLIPHCDPTQGGKSGATKKNLKKNQMCPSSPGQFHNIHNNTEIRV